MWSGRPGWSQPRCLCSLSSLSAKWGPGLREHVAPRGQGARKKCWGPPGLSGCTAPLGSALLVLWVQPNDGERQGTQKPGL